MLKLETLVLKLIFCPMQMATYFSRFCIIHKGCFFFSHMCSLWFDSIISLFTLFDIVNFLMPFGLATK
jgi:hypothetical protein